MAESIDPTSQPERLVTVSPPDGFPVEYGDVADHLRLTDPGEQSEFFDRLIAGATDYAEEELQASLLPRTLRATFYDCEPLFLPRGPLIEVQSVVDRYGSAITDFELQHAGRQARVVLKSSQQYPISVTYRAGYADADAIPASVKLAILCHIATLYENRESVSDRQMTPLPHSLQDFYRLKGRSVGIG